jgi:hypothetical protein
MLFTETTPYDASFLSLCFAVRRTLGAYIPDKDSLRIPHDICGAIFQSQETADMRKSGLKLSKKLNISCYALQAGHIDGFGLFGSLQLIPLCRRSLDEYG